MPTTGALIVSGYTEAGYGAGPGVQRFALQDDGTVGERTAEAAGVRNASFLAGNGGVLLAVEELKDGTVAALDPETLAVLGRASTGGADPCHVIHLGGSVWVANYSSGTAAVLPLAAVLEGAQPGTEPGSEPRTARPELLSHPGSGPVTGRQGESHAHQVTATPWGTVLVSDLGADRVDVYFADSRVLADSAELPPGTGPRHVSLKRGFMFVAGELDGHLHVLRRAEMAPGKGTGHFWRWLFKVPLAPTEGEIGLAKEFFPSHIQLSEDGTKLYAAVRGPNTLVVLDVSGVEGDSPRPPVFLNLVPSGGNWPRHFAVANHKIYVANQLSNNVAVFDLDENGLPGAEPVQTVAFGSPTCVVLA